MTMRDRGDTITVVIGDDHALVRQGLRLLIDRADGMRVLAEAGTTPEAMQVTRSCRPAVLVLDLNMPGGSSLGAIAWLRAHVPATAIVVLTMHDDPAFARKALQAGAVAFVLKEAADEELLLAIRLAAAGDTYLSPRLGAQLAAEPDEPRIEFTAREFDVLRLIALGYTNAEIAEQLFVSTRTVESERATVFDKLGDSSRAGLVRYALDHGVLSV
jgi:two-component system response regulator NreC